MTFRCQFRVVAQLSDLTEVGEISGSWRSVSYWWRSLTRWRDLLFRRPLPGAQVYFIPAASRLDLNHVSEAGAWAAHLKFARRLVSVDNVEPGSSRPMGSGTITTSTSNKPSTEQVSSDQGLCSRVPSLEPSQGFRPHAISLPRRMGLICPIRP